MLRLTAVGTDRDKASFLYNEKNNIFCKKTQHRIENLTGIFGRFKYYGDLWREMSVCDF